MTANASGTLMSRLGSATRTFTDRYPWVGPTVFVSSSLYFVAQVAVAWVWNPPYSLVSNTISDLGNTHCGQYRDAYVCSPRHDLMNVAFIFLGLVMVVGSLLVSQEFTERSRRERVGATIGFALLGLGGVGAILVGVFPENTVSVAHTTGAGLAIGVGNVAILVLGLSLPLPEGLRSFMLFIGTVCVGALLLFASHRDFGIGVGGMERVAAYPQTVWLIRFGLYMFKTHGSTTAAAAT
jgi:hypothetical membrane protein